MILYMNDGTEVEVDHAVVALGIDANDDLAQNSQLEIDEEKGGYRVNAELEARYIAIFTAVRRISSEKIYLCMVHFFCFQVEPLGSWRRRQFLRCNARSSPC